MFQLCFGNNPNGSDGLVLTVSNPRTGSGSQFQEFKTEAQQALARLALIWNKLLKNLPAENFERYQPRTATGKRPSSKSKLPHCTLPTTPHRCVPWIPDLDPSHPRKLLPQQLDLRLQKDRRRIVASRTGKVAQN